MQYIIIKDIDESSVKKIKSRGATTVNDDDYLDSSTDDENPNNIKDDVTSQKAIDASSPQKSTKRDLKNTKLLVIFRKTSQNVNENKLFLAVENLSIYVKVCEILKKKENNPIEGLDFEKRYTRFQSSWWPKSWKVVDN